MWFADDDDDNNNNDNDDDDDDEMTMWGSGRVQPTLSLSPFAVEEAIHLHH